MSLSYYIQTVHVKYRAILTCAATASPTTYNNVYNRIERDLFVIVNYCQKM